MKVRTTEERRGCCTLHRRDGSKQELEVTEQECERLAAEDPRVVRYDWKRDPC